MSTVVGPKLVFARPCAAAGKPEAGRIAEAAAAVARKSRRLIMAANPRWLILGGRPEEKLAAGLLHGGERGHADQDQDQQDREDLRDIHAVVGLDDQKAQAGTGPPQPPPPPPPPPQTPPR